MSKYRQVSPERSKVWTEKSPKYHYNHNYNHQQQNGKVPVVYYLCRNRQLEHPHFMEVPLSSPNGLYLRDVIERLSVLRGRCMASMYSWSCKRSYKNGFVWHDLCNDDLILPAHGNEYVLKGSELFEESNSGVFSPSANLILQNQKALPAPPSSRSQDEFSSSSRATKSSQDDELSPKTNHHCSLAISPESNGGKNSSSNCSLTLAEYKIYKSDAYTQTDEKAPKIVKTRETCTRGVSTDEPNSGTHKNEAPQTSFVSPPPSTSSASSSSGQTDTLESLIRADVKKINSFGILEEEGFRNRSNNSKLKASNMIMQLISCGSISVKDYSFGRFIPSYKPSFSHSKFSSPLYSTPSMFGEFDRTAENPRIMSMRVEDKEYFSGSLVETTMVKDNAERNAHQFDSTEGKKEEENSKSSKCIPISFNKASFIKHPRCESMRSPLSDGPRISSDLTPSSSNPGCKRISEPRKILESSKNDDEEVIKVEES